MEIMEKREYWEKDHNGDDVNTGRTTITEIMEKREYWKNDNNGIKTMKRSLQQQPPCTRCLVCFLELCGGQCFKFL